MNREAVIVDAVRTPVARKKGLFQHVRPEDLAAAALKGLTDRTGVDPAEIEDVIMGCVTQSGEQAGDIGRQAALIADYPVHVPGTTIDRQCGSGQQALHFAAQAVLSGDMDTVVAAGVENMTRVPMGSNFQGARPSTALTDRFELVHQGESAERIAEKWGFSRSALDAYAAESHERAIRAIKEGRFKREIVPVKVEMPDGTTQVLSQDTGPRPGTTEETLSKLEPVFRTDGVIHAGNASQISDGAGAVLVMSREKADRLGLKPRFRVHTRVVIGSDPTLMLTGPIPATELVLKKSGLTLNDIDVFEVNEAFASVPLAWLRETGADPGKLNPNGGAIALGHPLGASGIRLLTAMMSKLERTGGRYGLQTMCEGYGMANATIIERL
ncbi:acetyl-CoA C-acyltransferase [Alteribacter lacisalsi]|uniref:Acetyl-CoA C-acyltransferase n=1 Tax=Alteribacter lacisalsi TaxID=2045244 RepID=A0A2W0H762_9BACI|nr:thiolase family protein [Alteribacter lacisalsi]PYZ97694.1 acetyl-CoA C-acyltransferase [Alteribacter lacisalsi]